MRFLPVDIWMVMVMKIDLRFAHEFQDIHGSLRKVSFHICLQIVKVKGRLTRCFQMS